MVAAGRARSARARGRAVGVGLEEEEEEESLGGGGARGGEFSRTASRVLDALSPPLTQSKVDRVLRGLEDSVSRQCDDGGETG